MSIKLFPELLDTVLDFLHSDKDTLMACSLTCKAWLPTCRYHLFDELELTPPNVLAFLEYVDSSSSSIGAAVRQLVVRRESIYSVMRQLRITHAKSKAGKHFRGLQSLTLSETSWGFLSSDIRDILSNLVTVKDLKLHRSNFDTIHQAVEFICAFPALQSLSFKDSILVPNVDMHRFLTTAPRLSHSYPLHIYLDCLNLDRPKSILYLIEWLVVQEPSPLIQLDTLRLGPLRDRSLLPSLCIHKLMRMSDLPLARLQIKAPQFPYSAQESDDYLRHLVEIVGCKEIQSLSFDLILMSPPPDEFTPFRIGFIPDILTRLTWCRIQQISLAFVILQGSHLEIFDWKGIANILTQPQFDDLQHILIIIHIDRDDDDGRRKAEAVIKEGALSIFDSGRILDIEFRDEITGTYY